MDDKYEVLTNSASTIISILDKMCKLAKELNLTDKITVKLSVARNLVNESKGLIESNTNEYCYQENEQFNDYNDVIKAECYTKTEILNKEALSSVDSDTKIEIDNSSHHDSGKPKIYFFNFLSKLFIN